LGSLNLNDIVWPRSYEGMSRFYLVTLDKVSVFRDERIFYTFEEAQQFLNISHDTLYKLMKRGLPSHKIGRKRVFLIEDLIQWIKEH